MSDAMAIASVTAVIKGMLDNAMTDNSVSSLVGHTVTVTTVSPGLIKEGDSEPPQLNLFLYRVSPNAAWRNIGQPSRSIRGERLTNAPLALDLYYILTAYGNGDFSAETMLGYSMQVLHEMSVLTRKEIKKILSSLTGINNNLAQALSDSGIADQVELIKLTPHTMNSEEISKLWTAFSTGYRPSVAYQASVVLIENSSPGRSPLPVLTIGPQDTGVISQVGLVPPFPSLTAIQPPDKQISARLGDILTIQGHHLDYDSTAKVCLKRAHLEEIIEIKDFLEITETSIKLQLPSDPGASSTWAAGFYTVYAVFGTDKKGRSTNELALPLAPVIATIEGKDNKNVVDVADKTKVNVTFNPQVRPGQRVSLLIGNTEIPAQLPDLPTDSLIFNAESVAKGDYTAYMRVDGVDSLFIDLSSTPPSFDPKHNFVVSIK